MKANFSNNVVKPTPDGRSGNMSHFFNLILKLREAGLVRWAMKFLKIQEASLFLRYSIILLLVLFPFYAAFLAFLAMVKPW